MQDYNDMIDAIQKFVNFASYFIFSFVGSLLKEMYVTNSNRKYRFEPYKVVISTIVASLIAVAVKEYYTEILDQYWGIMGIISLILGFIGFELFYYISSIRGIRKVIGIFYSKEESILDSVDEVLDNKETTHKKDNLYTEPKIQGPIARTLDHDSKLISYKVSKPVIHNPENNDNNDDDELKK